MNKKIVMTLVCVVIVAEIGITGIYQYAAKNRNQKMNIYPVLNQTMRTQKRLQWKRLIDKLGPTAAYATVKKELSVLPYPQQHDLVHGMGELLYERLGVEAIAICDYTMMFGCFHGVLGQAVKEHGLTILSDVNRACTKNMGEEASVCRHGLGHGILYYLGLDKLEDALSACESIAPGELIKGCVPGVLMEYNYRTIATSGVTGPNWRPYDPANPYAPCPTVRERYRKACYLSQAQWWADSLKGDYAAAARLCRGLAQAEERTVCYIGVADTIASDINYDPGLLRKQCDDFLIPEAVSLCKKEIKEISCFQRSIVSGNEKAWEIDRLCQNQSP